MSLIALTPYLFIPMESWIGTPVVGPLLSLERENGISTPKEVVIVDDPRDDEKVEQEIPSIKLHGVVDKIVPSNHPSQPEKAQIAIEEAEELYKEIRIDNALHDGGGEKVKLKRGTEVELIVEAPHDGVDKGTDGEQTKKSA